MEFPSSDERSPTTNSYGPRLSYVGSSRSRPSSAGRYNSTYSPGGFVLPSTNDPRSRPDSLSYHSHIPAALRPGWSPSPSPSPQSSEQQLQEYPHSHAQPRFPVPQIPTVSNRVVYSEYDHEPPSSPFAMPTQYAPPRLPVSPHVPGSTISPPPPLSPVYMPYGGTTAEDEPPTPSTILPHYGSHTHDERVMLNPVTGLPHSAEPPTIMPSGGPHGPSASPMSSRPSTPRANSMDRLSSSVRSLSAHPSDGPSASSSQLPPTQPPNLPHWASPSGFLPEISQAAIALARPRSSHSSTSAPPATPSFPPEKPQTSSPLYRRSPPLPPSPPRSAPPPSTNNYSPVPGPSSASSSPQLAQRTHSSPHSSLMSPPPMYEPNPAVPLAPTKPPRPTSAPHSAIPEEDEDNALAEAIALSARQAEEDQRIRNLSDEEQLALALAESLRVESIPASANDTLTTVELEALAAASATSHGHAAPSSTFSHGSIATSATASSAYSAPEDQDWVRRREAAQEQMARDEELARALMREEQEAEAQTASPAATMSLTPNRPGMLGGFVRPESAPTISVAPPLEKASFLNRHRSAGVLQTGFPAPFSPGLPGTKPRSSSVDHTMRPVSVYSQLPQPPLLSPHSVSLSPLGERQEEWEMPVPSGPSRGVTPLPPADEMLMGVSLGFGPPPISTILTPLSSPFPNVMALPYGKCPPLHIQAQSWRHMLQLMARMASSRLEPTVEAMAARQQEPHRLRTVIQFVKVHRESPDWRTVIYFTLDHPVPLHLRSAQYAATNTTTLPYSYTLGTVPAVLRTGTDTPLSRIYVVPNTERTPYPMLPRDLPDIMTYLQSVLEASRAAAKDSPVRRLATMVQECYPEDPRQEDALDGEISRMGKIKRFMPKFRSKSATKNVGGNQETYQLITPFYVDDTG